MNSTDLSEFSSWQKWNSEGVRKAPNLPGVYAFRLVGDGFGRFKGKSDLVYIGCAERSVNRRLSDHLRSDRLSGTRKVGELEIAWKTLRTSEEAIAEEARLLRNYYLDHLELPPINRSEPASNRKAIEAVTEFIQADEQFKCESAGAARELAEKLVEHLTLKKRSEGHGGAASAADN